MKQIDFPRLVRDIRQARNLTQEGLARELGVTYSTVNCWENGKHRPMGFLGRRLLEVATSVGVVPKDESRHGSRAKKTTDRRKRRSRG